MSPILPLSISGISLYSNAPHFTGPVLSLNLEIDSSFTVPYVLDRYGTDLFVRQTKHLANDPSVLIPIAKPDECYRILRYF